jgi:hypothetical protein
MIQFIVGNMEDICFTSAEVVAEDCSSGVSNCGLQIHLIALRARLKVNTPFPSSSNIAPSNIIGAKVYEGASHAEI